MQLPCAAGMLATTFLTVVSARFVTSPSLSDIVSHAEDTAGPATAVESAPTYAPESGRTEDDANVAGNWTVAEFEYGANNTKRDVFADDVTLYVTECSEAFSKGECVTHEVVRSGSCHIPKWRQGSKTYKPDRGVSCHMLDSVCSYAFSWIADFQYPGTASTADDPIWRYAQLVDIQSMWCWIPSGNDPWKRTTPHFWWLPKMWRPMPWWQAPGVLQQGVEYDATWDTPRNGMP